MLYVRQFGNAKKISHGPGQSSSLSRSGRRPPGLPPLQHSQHSQENCCGQSTTIFRRDGLIPFSLSSSDGKSSNKSFPDGKSSDESPNTGHKSEGTSPVTEVPWMYKSSRNVKPDNSLGMVPLIPAFLAKEISLKRGEFPSSVGIVPVNWFEWTVSFSGRQQHKE